MTRLTKEEIDPANILNSMSDASTGAVVLFLGRVRSTSDSGSVDMIEYEAYEPMAEKRLAMTEEDVRRRWPATRAMRIVHRVGTLTVGEISVAVAVSSPHRAEAFEACRCAIDTIKHEVPIWKRERLADGREVWVGGVPVGSGIEPISKSSTGRTRRKHRAV